MNKKKLLLFHLEELFMTIVKLSANSGRALTGVLAETGITAITKYNEELLMRKINRDKDRHYTEYQEKNNATKAR